MEAAKPHPAKHRPEGTVCALFGLPTDKEPLADKTPEELAERLVADGINAVVHVPHKLELIKALKAAGIACYGEATYFCGEGSWKKHPESRPVQSEGSLMEKDGWYAGVCASQEQVVEEKLEYIRKQCRELPIDGVWLDFIRWPTRWEMAVPRFVDACYCPNCLERFQNETGIDIPDDLDDAPRISRWISGQCPDAWRAWRCGIIADACRRTKQVLTEEIGPNAVLGIFLVPLSREEFDGAIVDVFGQDVSLLAEHVDVFSPMSYHAMCERSVEWIGELNAEVRAMSRREVWPIVQPRDEPRPVSAEEYRQALLEGLSGGASGVMMFTAGDACTPEKWRVQTEVFRKFAGQ